MRNPPDVAVFVVNESGRGSLKFYSARVEGQDGAAVAAAAARNPFQSFRMRSSVPRSLVLRNCEPEVQQRLEKKSECKTENSRRVEVKNLHESHKRK